MMEAEEDRRGVDLRRRKVARLIIIEEERLFWVWVKGSHSSTVTMGLERLKKKNSSFYGDLNALKRLEEGFCSRRSFLQSFLLLHSSELLVCLLPSQGSGARI
ncbi:hypothetical protein E2542_SST14627 [Spatholobus suberectus]|nr:hypothetical protein E2542_SST14627 [Spatholobus suberectus]